MAPQSLDALLRASTAAAGLRLAAVLAPRRPVRGEAALPGCGRQPIAPSSRATRSTSTRRGCRCRRSRPTRKGGFADLVRRGQARVRERTTASARRSGRAASAATTRRSWPSSRRNLKDLAQYYHARRRSRKRARGLQRRRALVRRASWLSFPDDPDAARPTTCWPRCCSRAASTPTRPSEYERTAYAYPLGRDVRRPPAMPRWSPTRSRRSCCRSRERAGVARARDRFRRAVCADLPAASRERRRADARGAGPVRGEGPAARDRRRRATLLARKPPVDGAKQRIGWTIIGQAQFDQAAYAEAEPALQHALALTAAGARRTRRPHRAAGRRRVSPGRGQAQGRRRGRRGRRLPARRARGAGLEDRARPRSTTPRRR